MSSHRRIAGMQAKEILTRLFGPIVFVNVQDYVTNLHNLPAFPEKLQDRLLTEGMSKI